MARTGRRHRPGQQRADRVVDAAGRLVIGAEQTAAEVIRLRGVGVYRDQSMLVRDVDWTVRADESWVIVGPNGAGKTTILQIAGGLMVPTEGTAEVLGEPLEEADLDELRSRVGIASSAVAEQVPRGEKVIDLVLTASYGILGR